MASLTVCDPGDVHETIAGLKAEKIKCSVIALAAEVKICQTLCTATEGTHTVILHRQHFVESLLEHCTPPASTAGGHVTRLIRLGFPKLVAEIGPCSCCETPDLHEEGYMCPQCKVRRTWLIALCLLSYCFSAARRAFSPSGHPYDASSSPTRCAFSPSGQPAIISTRMRDTFSFQIFFFLFVVFNIYIYIFSFLSFPGINSIRPSFVICRPNAEHAAYSWLRLPTCCGRSTTSTLHRYTKRLQLLLWIRVGAMAVAGYLQAKLWTRAPPLTNIAALFARDRFAMTAIALCTTCFTSARSVLRRKERARNVKFALHLDVQLLLTSICTRDKFKWLKIISSLFVSS